MKELISLKDIRDAETLVKLLEGKIKTAKETAEKEGRLVEFINGKKYVMTVTECKREIANAVKFFETQGKRALEFMSVKIAEARKVLGAEAVNASVEDFTTYKTRSIKIEE